MEALLLIRSVVEAEGRQNKVEAIVGERELLDGAIHEVDVWSTCPCRSSLLHHSRRRIHPDELGIRELSGHPAQELPGATSDIENGIDGPGGVGGFFDRRSLHWSEEERLQNRAVIVRRPTIEVRDVPILCHQPETFSGERCARRATARSISRRIMLPMARTGIQ